MKNFDVAVVGLGAVGSAALYQLSKTGLNVVGIDMHEPPHSFGSSFGETRLTRQAIGEGSYYTPMVLRANEIWAELEKVSGKELFNRCGMVMAAYEEQQFYKNTLQAAKEFSINYQLLDGNEVERLFPAISAAQTDNVYYYEPTSGFLRPEQCIAVELACARDNKATTLLNTKVQSIVETKRGVEVALSDGETILADKVIVTSGPWIKDMLNEILAPILTTYLYTLFWYDIDKTHYKELTPDVMPVVMGGDDRAWRTSSFYGFPAISGPDGGVKYAMGESELQAAPDEKDAVKPPASLSRELHEYLSRYVRYIKPDTLRSFNCLYTSTPDGNFILDFAPGSERIIVGSACSGHGFKHSAASGEILAQLAIDGELPYDISEFSLSRF